MDFDGLLELSSLAFFIDKQRWATQQGAIISLQNIVAHYCGLYLSKVGLSLAYSSLCLL